MLTTLLALRPPFHNYRATVWVALIITMSIAVWSGTPVTQAQSDQALYIPALARNWAAIGIHGQLLLNGSPAAGEVVVLGNPANAPAYSTVLTTMTEPDGTYSFLTAPVLAFGNTYHVIYVAPSPGAGTRIDYVQSSPIAYATQSFTSVPAIEIAPIVLIDPAPNATVPNTYTYRWAMPPALTAAQPTSIWWRAFARNVFGMISDPMTSGPGSSSGEYSAYINLGSCGFCFVAGYPYRWHIEMSGPNGEYRETADRFVTFASP